MPLSTTLGWTAWVAALGTAALAIADTAGRPALPPPRLAPAPPSLGAAARPPSRLAPLKESIDAPVPAGSPQDPHPETLAVALGHPGDVTCARGRGYLHAPVSSVLAALEDPAVVVDRREVTSWTVQPSGPLSFRLHNEVHGFVSVEFDTLWQLTVVGPAGAPTAVVGRAQKVGGTRLISLLADSIEVRRVDDQTSSVDIVRTRRSLGHDADAATYVRDLFASLRARVHGQPLPTY